MIQRESDPWVLEEGRIVATVRQTLVRPLRRPLYVLGLALGVTLLGVGLRALQRPLYKGTIFFRVEETQLTEQATGSPRAPRQIKEHVSNVALSRRRLEELMRRHEIAVAWLDRDREGAIQSFREDVEIEVSRDFFVLQRRPGDPPRSAHVSISLLGDDKDQVTAILRDIGEAVLESQEKERAGDFSGSSQLLRAQLGTARAALAELQERTGQAWSDLAGAKGDAVVELRTRIASLELERSAMLRQVISMERRAEELDLGVLAEEEQRELSFGTFDESMLTLRAPLTLGQLARRAVAAFVVALVLVTVFVGAFDDRVHDARDMSARGLPVLGAYPRFPGDEIGALRERTSSSKA